MVETSIIPVCASMKTFIRKVLLFMLRSAFNTASFELSAACAAGWPAEKRQAA